MRLSTALAVVATAAVILTLSGQAVAFVFDGNGTHLTVTLNGILLVQHTPASPFLSVGKGMSSSKSQFGNYRIRDYVERKVPLTRASVAVSTAEESGTTTKVTLDDGCSLTVAIDFVAASGKHYMKFGELPEDVNRVWLRLHAEEGEHVYGGGEQFTYFDMRGHLFPLWVQEQGVGRNKSSLITLLANNRDNGGGDYFTTYWAQPTYLSSRRYYAHFTTRDYSEFDFQAASFHEVYLWGTSPGSIHFFTGSSYLELMEKFTGYQGRQPLLPEWVYNGVTLGLQGGTERMLKYLKLAQDNDIKVSSVWIQDWAGRIKTSFGRRIFWNWEWDPKHYPNLDKVVADLDQQGVKVLVYANLNLNREGNLFKEAEGLGYLILDKSGNTYILDYGEFFCGIVDITNPAAAQWYKDRIIKKNMIDLGLGGWMADFGEYLPTDAVFHNGMSGSDLHNIWPTLWAQINREGVEEAGKLGEILYWMRAGFSGAQKYGVMTWAGDQFVDFSLSDGIASVIPAALSLGVSGFGLFHFDIGGYTSLFGYTRTPELIFRYGEMAAFTSMMRTHEGNRPDENLQIYSNDCTLSQLAYHTKLYRGLNAYRRTVVWENTEQGIPTQRPLFAHYENDPTSYGIQYQYLFGRDLLVAPVHEAGRETWDVYLPPDNWVFLWDETVTSKGGETVTVPSPIGKIPVFFRQESEWATSFRALRNIKLKQCLVEGKDEL
ncbi:sulfoquinovosidase-like [Diadema setosum]|uniref:sulfoquinovosidase-like n=1 Tax=Diadema setosum TaxID=31175 RepID=UPI003B3A57C4